MAIAIVCYNPSFSMSHLIRDAFSKWDKTHLFSLKRDWRDFDPGVFVSDENAGRCRKVIEKSRLVFMVGIPGMKTLDRMCPKKKDFFEWARTLNLAVLLSGTVYTQRGEYQDIETGEPLYIPMNEVYNEQLKEMGIKKIFAPPDLFHLAPPGTALLFPPIKYPKRPKKPKRLYIAHSPGTKPKRRQKGTDGIEKVVAALQKRHDFDYRTIMDKRIHAECLKLKAPAHIFIDQVPPRGLHSGLGKSGLEALSFASVVVSAFRWPEGCDEFFPPPPVLPVFTRRGVIGMLETLLDMPRWMLEEMGVEGREWAKKHTALGPWLDYVRQYV